MICAMFKRKNSKACRLPDQRTTIHPGLGLPRQWCLLWATIMFIHSYPSPRNKSLHLLNNTKPLAQQVFGLSKIVDCLGPGQDQSWHRALGMCGLESAPTYENSHPMTSLQKVHLEAPGTSELLATGLMTLATVFLTGLE